MEDPGVPVDHSILSKCSHPWWIPLSLEDTMSLEDLPVPDGS